MVSIVDISCILCDKVELIVSFCWSGWWSKTERSGGSLYSDRFARDLRKLNFTYSIRIPTKSFTTQRLHSNVLAPRRNPRRKSSPTSFLIALSGKIPHRRLGMEMARGVQAHRVVRLYTRLTLIAQCQSKVAITRPDWLPFWAHPQSLEHWKQASIEPRSLKPRRPQGSSAIAGWPKTIRSGQRDTHAHTHTYNKAHLFALWSISAPSGTKISLCPAG